MVRRWVRDSSLEAIRYLSPAKDMHDKLDKVQIAGVLGSE